MWKRWGDPGFFSFDFVMRQIRWNVNEIFRYIYIWIYTGLFWNHDLPNLRDAPDTTHSPETTSAAFVIHLSSFFSAILSRLSVVASSPIPLVTSDAAPALVSSALWRPGRPCFMGWARGRLPRPDRLSVCLSAADKLHGGPPTRTSLWHAPSSTTQFSLLTSPRRYWMWKKKHTMIF